jgi:hypothetical protein
MSKRFFLTIFTVLTVLAAIGKVQPEVKTATAIRTTVPPRIDGVLDDPEWNRAIAINSFTQYEPDHHQPESQTSMVFFLYDDEAIYVGALLFDSAPDSILTQLGTRDEGNLNADWFSVSFDTYFNRLDAYTFRVTASGVQADFMLSDGTYDAVWQSATRITKVGWVVEMKIPYSAIRFPNESEQLWGLQVQRYIRRHRELSEWSPTPRGVPNRLLFWGELHGLSAIQPPLRLSLTPYMSTSLQHDQGIDDPDARYALSYGGGADLKYGIDQSFTLDMTLFPDFSQVKSDNKVKNLSAFETVYAEQRPFFQEAVDIFNKGGLFYSRRIGGQPAEFNNVSDRLDSTEIIISNPVQAKLLNATKVSGRNKRGLAIGFLNAVTGNTYATVENEKGRRRDILTDPLTNFNVTVLDQVLPNNSSAYLINTSVVRSKKYDNANVTGAGTNLMNRSNTLQLNASGALSQVFNFDSDAAHYERTQGYKYHISAGKPSGNFQFNLYRNVMDDSYDDNDLGITHRNDFVSNGANFNYYIFEPFWVLRSFRALLNLSRETSFTTGENLNTWLNTGANITFQSYVSSWIRFTVSPWERYDYYDPRSEGRFYIRPGYANASIGFSTDYRKPVALDGSIWMGYDQEEYIGKFFRLEPRIRLSDSFNFNYSFAASLTGNSRGYVTTIESEDIIYGNRNLTSYENIVSGRYMFQNNLSLSLWMRHYWYIGLYDEYFLLSEEGRLISNPEYDENNDFNFNTFNIDLMLNWEFAPGSEFSIVWKNAILNEEENITFDFLDNFKQTIHSDQLNQVSLKFLYYLDYQTLFKSSG